MLQSMYLNSKESETIANVSKELTNYNASKENCYNYNEEVLLSVTRKLFKEKPKPTFIQRNKGKIAAGLGGIAGGAGGAFGYTRYINRDTQSAATKAAQTLEERLRRAEANSAYYREKFNLDEHGNPIKGWFGNAVDSVTNFVGNVGNKVSDGASRVNAYVGSVREKKLLEERVRRAEANSEKYGKEFGLDKYGRQMYDEKGFPLPSKLHTFKDWQNVKDKDGNDVMLSAYVDNPYTRMRVVDINNTTKNSSIETLGDLGRRILGKTNETVGNVVNSGKKMVDNITDSNITKSVVEFVE